jgi:LuxR family transcriptional regulator, maltose regulon positive regulatory protein
MSAMPVEALIEDEVVIFLEPVVLQALLQTVTHLPPGTPLVLRGRPGLGSDVVQATSVSRAVAAEPRSRTRGSLALVEGLSAAERRVLVYLRTHLTLAEIAARLFVSRNTVKSQAISIYRKLGVSSRSDAVRIAVEADLLGAVVRALPRP